MNNLVLDLSPLRDVLAEEVRNIKPQKIIVNRENEQNQDGVPIWHKVTITIDEAAKYSGIGLNKLQELTRNPKCSFVLYVGSRKLIKRKKFDEFLENHIEI